MSVYISKSGYVSASERCEKFAWLEAHMPIPDHIFFLCKACHDKLDKDHSITITDIKSKRSGTKSGV